jgi:hypothetical protein
MLLEELQADLKAMAFGNTGAWLVRMTVRWLSEHSAALLYRLSMHCRCWTTRMLTQNSMLCFQSGIETTGVSSTNMILWNSCDEE